MMLPQFLEKVLKNFRVTASAQEAKGILKYGTALDPMDEKWDWLIMAEEELVDGYKYLLAERYRRDQVIKEVLNLVDYIVEERDANFRSDIRADIKEKLQKISRNIDLL